MSARPTSLPQIVELARAVTRRPVLACAAAEDGAVLQGVTEAARHGIADAILIGDADRIRRLTESIDMPAASWRIEHVPDPTEACRRAVALCRQGTAQALMKGQVATATFMGAVLDPTAGVRGTGTLSHVTAFSPPGADRLLLLADAGLNIAPDVARKLAIISNTVTLAHALGILRPRVALLAAVEYDRPEMPATADAAEIVRQVTRGPFPACAVGGPYSLDVAVSAEAARIKDIHDEIAGCADILIAPDIEAGNILYKSLICFAQLELASLVLGALIPLIVASRADSGRTKLYSIALAAYVAALAATPATARPPR
jgi:phosphate butyryltransferase